MTRAIVVVLFALTLVDCSADPNEQANRLFVEAQQLIEKAEKQELVEAIQALIAAEDKLRNIVTKYPAANLAVQLASGQSVGSVSLAAVQTLITNKQAIKMFAEAKELIIAGDKQNLEERVKLLLAAEEKLKLLVDRHTTADLAFQLAAGEHVDKISFFTIRAAIVNAERDLKPQGPDPSVASAPAPVERESPPPATDQLKCPQEHNARSVDATQATSILFVNARQSTVRIYWVDYKGRRNHYVDLTPGRQYVQQTYMTHPWVVTDQTERCLTLYMPEIARLQARIQ